ncbi:hypothetical protein Vadar_001344 [Vaccinium darrowii]|uniref:Uncharacterized protein n=1 Tax=Vaccinium darrowii TaxID=229202 RepID=A0ACB7Z8S9_9ERIC|nr:hypothetical protein Vadar_001344 [Vaccinium darrowii]
MATHLMIFGVSINPLKPPFLQSNVLVAAADDNNNYQDWQIRRIGPSFIDNFSRFNQESVDIRVQGPQERRQRRPGPPILSLVLNSHDSNHWKVKKTLTKSDVNDLCRLMLKTTTVQEHILNKWDEEWRRAVMETEQGVRVNVLDLNTDTTHQLVLKRWQSSGSFVFTNNWMAQFVRRRELKEGDEIGFYWDSKHSSFEFCVLSWV